MSIPRISSRTPLQGPLLPLHTPNEKPHTPLLMAQLTAVLHPRRSRQRTTLLALLSLTLLTVYVFLVHFSSASLALRRPEVKPTPNQLTIALESIRKSGLATVSQSTQRVAQIRLSNAQELAAVSSFLASLPQNQIPSFVDPSNPIDPQLVLDFDTRSSRASGEVQAMVDDVWSRNPVFLYSKRYSPASREVKVILNNFHLKPSPTIIDVDVRDDGDVLIPMLRRLTSFEDLPVLIVAGNPVGTIQDIHQMDAEGTLQQIIAQSGAVIGGAKKH